MLCAALAANPPFDIQFLTAFAACERAATPTDLGRRVKPIGNQDAPATHLGLVLELPADFVESAVQHCTGKAVVLGHAGHIQIFDYDRLEPPGEVGRQLVRRICADVGYGFRSRFHSYGG